MRNLFIYHPGTGTVISLGDEMYLCDADNIGGAIYDAMLDGATDMDAWYHKGIRIDNWNMGNLFYGMEE